jgi:hypothetical protein
VAEAVVFTLVKLLLAVEAKVDVEVFVLNCVDRAVTRAVEFVLEFPVVRRTVLA